MRLILFIIAISQIAITFSYVLPEEISKISCKKTDSNLDYCLLNKLRVAHPYLMKGIPKLNMIPLDPLIVDNFIVNGNVRDAFILNATLKNVKIIGIDKVNIEQVSLDVDNMEFYMKMFFPKIVSQLEYDTKGTLFNIPIENQGVMFGNATDIPLEVTAKLVKRTRKNQEYFKIKDMTVKSQIGNGVIKMISKDPDFQPIADTIVDFFNRNTRTVFDIANPLYVQAAATAFTSFFNPPLSRVPIKELLSN